MATVGVAMTILTMSGCASEPTAPPASPSSTNAAAEAMGATMRAQARESEARALAAHDTERTTEAQRPATTPAELEKQVQVAQAAHDKAEIERVRTECAASRGERVALGQRKARDYVAFAARITPHMKTIRASCEIKDTTGTRVERQRDGAETIVRTRRVGQVDALACSGGIPKGLSEDDVKETLYAMHDPKTASDTVLWESNECTHFDRELGLATPVTKGDVEAMKKLLAWKAPPAP